MTHAPAVAVKNIRTAMAGKPDHDSYTMKVLSKDVTGKSKKTDEIFENELELK